MLFTQDFAKYHQEVTKLDKRFDKISYKGISNSSSCFNIKMEVDSWHKKPYMRVMSQGSK